MTDQGLILALETSSSSGSVALFEGATVIAERRFQAGMRGGNEIAPGVAVMLGHAGTRPIAAVAVGIGPGSYTGTRVGVVYAKAFSWARRIPLYGVCGLEALAVRLAGGMQATQRVAIAMAAHETRIYGAAYDVTASCASIVVPPSLMPRAALIAAAGPGARVVDAPPEFVLAIDVGSVAAARRARDAAGDALAQLEPLYLQAPPPERAAT